jgi:hypothetical protein
MTPQSNVMVTAPVKIGREAELRALLASMNEVSGRVNPANPLVPFEQFGQLHVARFVILQDQTLDDLHTAYGLPRADYPLELAFIADFDGTADDFRADLARRAADGLRRIFSCCEGFAPDGDLARWMKDHENPAATMYQNWRGRTVRQVREENALRLALEAHLQSDPASFAVKAPRQVHSALKDFVDAEVRSGRLTLTDPSPTPPGWWLRNLLHFVGVPLALLLLAPFMILYSPVYIYQLRRREKHDPEIAPPVDPDHEQKLSRLEDHDVTNQFTAMGSVKPGLLRRWTLVFLFWVLNWTTRHIYIRGHLSRVPTIHFARWVFVDQKRRLVFASNYDGSLESYMDDFINKVGWGLNLVFSNGVGYPTSNWLILDGCKDEQRFKGFLRRHQLPTEVWYKAYPGLTAFDLKRNTLIRQGLGNSAMSDAELRQWIALF